MSVFSDLIKVDQNGNIYYNGWIQWFHVPMGFRHCETCLALHNCWFQKNNMPQMPQHPKCHCKANDIQSPTPNDINAECKIEKFTGYIFSDLYLDNGKKALFTIWGYTIEDSEYLKQEYEKQARKKYTEGNYELRKLDEHGQRINITIILNKNNRTYTIISGWMVKPNGKLLLITPLADD